MKQDETGEKRCKATGDGEQIGSHARSQRACARTDEGGDEARGHEHQPGLERAPSEHVLQVKRVDNVECGCSAEQQRRADVGAHEQR